MPSNYFKDKVKTLENTRFSRVWSCWADLNRRPHPYQGCALPTELQQHKWRPGTGSNRRPLAWQASVLTNWTTGPFMLYGYAFNAELLMAGAEGFEPSARGFGDRCSTSWAIPLNRIEVSLQAINHEWWAFGDSNPGPIGYEPTALTNWAKGPRLSQKR